MGSVTETCWPPGLSNTAVIEALRRYRVAIHQLSIRILRRRDLAFVYFIEIEWHLTAIFCSCQRVL